jgi:hypothetical protein
MATQTRKQAIVARIMDNLQPLQSEGKVRKIRRVKSINALAAVKPSLHVVIGPETVLSEDHRGFACQFPLVIDAMVASSEKDGYDDSDALADEVKRVIELDQQLSGLCVKVEYNGDEPYTNEVAAPEGGTFVFYNVQYRRDRGNPTIGY